MCNMLHLVGQLAVEVFAGVVSTLFLVLFLFITTYYRAIIFYAFTHPGIVRWFSSPQPKGKFHVRPPQWSTSKCLGRYKTFHSLKILYSVHMSVLYICMGLDVGGGKEKRAQLIFFRWLATQPSGFLVSLYTFIRSYRKRSPRHQLLPDPLRCKSSINGKGLQLRIIFKPLCISLHGVSAIKKTDSCVIA